MTGRTTRQQDTGASSEAPAPASRLSPEAHARHHERIGALVENASKAADKRRAFGYAASILRSHLGSAHGVRMLSGPPRSLADLHALHVQKHEAETRDSGSARIRALLVLVFVGLVLSATACFPRGAAPAPWVPHPTTTETSVFVCSPYPAPECGTVEP